MLTYKTTTRETTECLFNLSLYEAKALAALRAASKAILDGLPNEVSSSDDLTNKLPRYPLKENVDPDKADYDYGRNLYTVYEASWSSENKAVLAVSKVSHPFYSPYKVTVTPAQSDTQVTLTLTMTYSGRTDLTVSDTHTLTVKAAPAAPVDYAALLNAALTAQIRLRTKGALPADFDQFTLLAEQSIELTVLPMEQSEIDAAAAFMKKA